MCRVHVCEDMHQWCDVWLIMAVMVKHSKRSMAVAALFAVLSASLVTTSLAQDTEQGRGTVTVKHLSRGVTVYNVTVVGNAVLGAETFVTELIAGDHVVIDNISGMVCFDTNRPSADCVYDVDAAGLSRAIYDDPENQYLCMYDVGACNDPMPSNGHAGLYMKRTGTLGWVGRNGVSFNQTSNRTLYLGVNDCSGAGSPAPNNGSFSVRVTVSHPELSINDVQVTEGNSGTVNATFQVTTDPAPASGQTVTVNYETSDGTAMAPGDYTVVSDSLTFTSAAPTQTITVSVVSDVIYEADETFYVNLSGASGAIIADGTGTCTILNDDPMPTATPTRTPTATWTSTRTPVSPTNTPVGPTNTPVPPTNTPVSPSHTPTRTPTATWTSTRTPTPTVTPPITPTQTPVPPTNTPAIPTGTPVPPSNTPVFPTETPASPTETPVPATETPTPEATSTCGVTGVTVSMPAHIFHPGDACSCSAVVCNATGFTMYGYPLFVILDAYGSYFFAPSFGPYDNYLEDYPEFAAGETVVEVLSEFEWPAGVGSSGGLIWYGALTDPLITRLFGEMDTWEFGWED